jgi:hypothetical protein
MALILVTLKGVEDVTYHTGYDSREELMAQLEQFQQEINATP